MFFQWKIIEFNTLTKEKIYITWKIISTARKKGRLFSFSQSGFSPSISSQHRGHLLKPTAESVSYCSLWKLWPGWIPSWAAIIHRQFPTTRHSWRLCSDHIWSSVWLPVLRYWVWVLLGTGDCNLLHKSSAGFVRILPASFSKNGVSLFRL